ncbi:hypothetical protein ACK3TF_005943 [Chlorella vulgaris]
MQCASSRSQCSQTNTSLWDLLHPQPLSLQRGAYGISWQRSFFSHGSNSSSLASRSGTVDVAVLAAAKRRVGRPASVVPEFDAQQLLTDMQLDGYGSADELAASMSKLPGIRQQGILQHGPQVAAHLRGLGIGSSELGLLFCRCPELFSWPAEERAGVLYSQLMRLGLSAGQAARCFEQQPQAAVSISFGPAIAVLATLLAAGSKGGGRPGEQLLGDMLKKQPGAVGLLNRGISLQRNLDNLLQLGFSKQQLVAALLQSWALLTCTPEHLARMEAVLQHELGADRQLWVKVLGSKPRVASCTEANLRQRAQALVMEFGKEEACRMADVAPQLLAINTVVWRRALAVWRQCGVADPLVLACSSPKLLGYDWLHRSRMANLRALQQWLPWELSAAQVIESYGGYVVRAALNKMAGRLLYLEQLGLLPLLVADKPAAKREWRLQQGLSGSKKAAGEPVFISVGNVADLSSAKFDSLVDSALSQQQQQQQYDDGLVCSSSSCPSFEAFRRGRLLQLPAWKQLLAQAEADVVELEKKLPPELLQNGSGKKSPQRCKRLESVTFVGLQRFVSSGMAITSRAVVAWQLRGPPIPQAHRSPARLLALQLRPWRGSVRSSSSNSGSMAVAEVTDDSIPAQAKWRGGNIASVVPQFDAQQLLRDVQLDGYSSADELSASMGKLPGIRQQGILQHGPQVAAHLRGLGIGRRELGPLFCRCPELFSRPVEERAGVLLSQLMRLGLSAGQAARCFEQHPWGAVTLSFQPAIAVLAPLLDAGSKGGGRTGEQLLGDLLKKQPAAVRLLQYNAEAVQRNLDSLLQLGLTKQQLAKALKVSWALLTNTPDQLARMEAVVQQELGADRELWVKVLRSKPRAAGCSDATLRQRLQALVAEFGKEEACRMVQVAIQVLAINTVVWRRALAVWQQCGVADPRAVACSNPNLLGYDWLHRSRLANLRALQQWLPWEPSAALVIERYAGYVTSKAADRVAGRLLYLEQLGLLPLLVADKPAAKREWRLQQGLSSSKKAAGEPVFISVANVADLSSTRFDSLVDSALSQQQQDDDGLVSSTSTSPSFEAFRKGRLLQLPAWKQLLVQAEADVAELERKLPPELLQKADAESVVAWQLRGPPIAQVRGPPPLVPPLLPSVPVLLASSQPALLSVPQLCDPTSLISLAHRSPAHQLMPQRQRWRGSVRSSSSSSGSMAVAATIDDAVSAPVRRRRGGSIASVVPEFDAQQLLRDVQLDGHGSSGELLASMGKLPGIRQQGILQHGPQVASHLRGLGIGRRELGLLFCRCPELFSRPTEERAGALYGQLMRLGLTAGQASRCFEQQPGAAVSLRFEPAISVLAPLLAAGSKGGGRSGEQLLGDLLKKQPAAVGLLMFGSAALQHNLDNLLQLGLSKQQVAQVLPQNPALLAYAPERLAKLEAVVQQELGANRQLWVKVLGSASRVAICTEAALRQRAQALVAEFGKEEACRMVGVAPQLLVINTVVWRRALAVWQQCGVADPRAVAHSNPQPLGYDWLHRFRLANLRALQQWLPWDVSAAPVIERHGGCVASYAADRVAGRLLYLEQLSLLPLLVADKLAAKREWRLQQGLSGSKKAAGEPVFITVRDVAILAPAKFDGLVDSVLSQQQQQQDDDCLVSSNSSSSCPSFEAFRKGRLLQLPAWKQLLAQAEADLVKLESMLPPELLQNGSGKKRAG